MSFLDNLENNLKALESREEKDTAGQANRREAERARALAVSPWAERLRNGSWTQALLQQATRAGYARRTKVNLAWIDTTLRLEARNLRLELRPEPDGVMAVFLQGTEELRQEPVDLSGDPQTLVDEWMALI
jgi:hypothetical protein